MMKPGNDPCKGVTSACQKGTGVILQLRRLCQPCVCFLRELWRAAACPAAMSFHRSAASTGLSVTLPATPDLLLRVGDREAPLGLKRNSGCGSNYELGL